MKHHAPNLSCDCDRCEEAREAQADEAFDREGDEDEMLIECDACDGDGWQTDPTSGLKMECPECGGEGWI